MIDFRSDTVTRPTPAMKQAMLEAPLGDDVLGDDPSVIALETQAAERAGKEAALFMPSGTMANLVALTLHTRPGDEILLADGAHPLDYEAGGAAVVAGAQIRPIAAERGLLDPEAVAVRIRPVNDHFAPATLLCIEDTANRGGGTVYPLDRLDALTALAKERGLAVHLDGARVFNAVVKSGIPLARRVRDVDTVSFCFSKGLGAPVGSVLCGTKAQMQRARRIRKLLGGGMRQSGILAAACTYALANHVQRLADDHARAQRLVQGLEALGYACDPCETNLVYTYVPDAPAAQAHLERHGVLALAVGPTTMRLVTHLDVGDADVTHTLQAFRDL